MNTYMCSVNNELGKYRIFTFEKEVIYNTIKSDNHLRTSDVSTVMIK